MISAIKIKISIQKKYLQYIRKKYSIVDEYDPTLYKDNFSSTVHMAFSSPYRNIQVNGYKKENHHPADTDVLWIIIPSFLFNANYIQIGDAHVNAIERYIKRLMYDEIQTRVKTGKDYGITRKEILWKFLNDYDLEDFLSFDAIEKWCQRNIGHNKVVRKVS